MADLFSAALPDQADKPSPDLVDWSFLDEDDGHPGEPGASHPAAVRSK